MGEGRLIYSAWFDLHNDDTIVSHPTALRVYAVLVRDPMNFVRPGDVKAWLVAELLHTHRDRVGAALDLLAQRGYIKELERGQNNVRRILVLAERTQPADVGCPPNKAAPKSA